MEKIISEFRVIETDDGYRIEIKGDKEKMKSFMKENQERAYHGWRRKRGWHPWWGFNPAMWMHMESCRDAWNERRETESEAEEA